MRNLLIPSFLALAASCAANTQTTSDPVNRPDPATGGYQAPQPRAEAWVSLGPTMETSPIQRTVEVGGHGGRISNLMIKGTHGEAEVTQVIIQYMDKAQKKVELHKTFLPGDAQVIELREDRPIDKIIVFIDPDTDGHFQIFGA